MIPAAFNTVERSVRPNKITSITFYLSRFGHETYFCLHPDTMVGNRILFSVLTALNKCHFKRFSSNLCFQTQHPGFCGQSTKHTRNRIYFIYSLTEKYSSTMKNSSRPALWIMQSKTPVCVWKIQFSMLCAPQLKFHQLHFVRAETGNIKDEYLRT